MHGKKPIDQLTTMLEQPLDLLHHLPFRIAVVSNLLMLNRDGAIKNTMGLGARELRVIVNVGSYMPITSADVAYQSKMDTYTVSRAVKTLTEKGLVVSQTLGDNKRNKYLVLTEEGQDIYLELIARMRSRELELTEELSLADQRELNKILKKLEVKAEEMLAKHALDKQECEGPLSAEQKELIRWHKKTQKADYYDS